jgi:DNA-binding winged helix-turn-helix (wHTH) protein
LTAQESTSSHWLSAGTRQATELCIDSLDECLWDGQRKIELPPKAFALVRYLAERQGRLVTKAELLDAIWPGVCVDDGVVKVIVRTVRAALQDDADAPRFVQTVHRRGYRWIGAVRFACSAGVRPAAKEPSPSSPKAPFAAAVHTTRRPIVGRDAPLRILREHLARALTGIRQVVWVSGEVGIGKTSLIDAFLSELDARGPVVARGQSLDHAGDTEPYFPILDAMGRLLRASGRHELLAIMLRYAPTWLAQMPALIPRDQRSLLEREILGATRDRMLREMAEAVEAMAEVRPLVLVLEDLHWSDASTLNLLSALARRPESTRLLVIGSYRPSPHRVHWLARDLVARGLASNVALDHLDEPAIAALLGLRFGRHGFPASFVQLVHQRTEGNPLFIDSLIDHLVAQQWMQVDADGVWTVRRPPEEIMNSVPDGLRQMIDCEIERLDPPDQALLESASVAGLEMSSAVLARVLDIGQLEAERRCQRLAEREHFLMVRSAAELYGACPAERYAFVHGLYQQVLYQRLTPARREELHRGIAEAIEVLTGQRAALIAAELARHFELARASLRAITYYRQAARNAIQRCATEEAVACLQRGLVLADGLDAAAAMSTRLELREQLGLVLRAAGEASAAGQFAEVAREARHCGRTDLEASAYLYAASTLSWFDRERCLESAHQAERLSGHLQDELLRAHVRGYAAYARLIWRRWSSLDASRCEAAVAVARRAGARDQFAFHLGRFVHVQLMRSHYADAAVSAREGLAFAEGSFDPYDYAMCQYWRGWALLHAGAWGELTGLLDVTSHAVERNGHGRLTLLFRLLRASLHDQAGDLETARDLATRSLSEARAADYAFGELMAHVLLGSVALSLGQHEQAGDLLQGIERRLSRERLLMDWIWALPLTHALARLAWANGDRPHAMRLARDLCRRAAPIPERTWLALGNLLIAQLTLHERHRAKGDRAIGIARHIVARGDLPLAEWRVHRALATLHAGDQQSDRADEARRAEAAVVRRLADSFAVLSQPTPLLDAPLFKSAGATRQHH